MPIRCRLCGDENYPLSMGGPTLCPSCDSGLFVDHGLAVKRMLGLKPPPTTNERAAHRAAQTPGVYGNPVLAPDLSMFSLGQPSIPEPEPETAWERLLKEPPL